MYPAAGCFVHGSVSLLATTNATDRHDLSPLKSAKHSRPIVPHYQTSDIAHVFARLYVLIRHLHQDIAHLYARL